MKKRIYSLCFALGIGITTLFAQQGIVSSGGNASGTGGTVSYSVGQVAFSYVSGTNFNLMQGVQVPYEIYVVDVEEPERDIKLNAVVYPVPVIDGLTLSIPEKEIKNLHYVMYNLNGNRISEGKIESESTQVNTASMAEGVYFLSVYDNSKVLKTFKILKQF